MIDTPDRAQPGGTPSGSDRLGPNDRVAVLVHKIRSPLTAIWNAVHLLSFARDEETVDKVRQMVIRQLECLSEVLDGAEGQRVGGGRPEQGPAAGNGLARADAADA